MGHTNRRSFLAFLAGTSLHSLALRPALARTNRPAPKPRRLIVNCDGSVIHCWGRTIVQPAHETLTRQQFVELVFGPIEDAGVDALFFSFGSGNVAEYQSNVLEWPGQADAFKFPDSRTWHGGIEVDPSDQYRNPHGLAAAGHNPPNVIVEECHRRGMDAFVSLRMNDTHDAQHPKGDRPNPELPTFKRQNPHWLVENLDRWSALNYAKPQVRALKLRVIEEFFDRWDFDGIELDWLRHTVNFPRGTEQENAKYLTDFLRQVRQSLDARAAVRGRPIEIAVRVPERLAWCLLGGYDVPAWIKEGLIDILILGHGLNELPTLDEFRTYASELPIYPCIVPFGNGYRISPDELIRGSAANLWHCGASGIYAFNWSNYGMWRRDLLSELADPGKLAKGNKHYLAAQRFDAGPSVGTDYLRFNTAYRAAQVPTDLNVADGARDISLYLSTVPGAAELWLATRYNQQGDELAVRCNGVDLANSVRGEELKSVGYDLKLAPGNGMIGLPETEAWDMRFTAQVWKLPVKEIVAGKNVITLQLKARGAGSEKSLQIRRVEIRADSV